MMEKRKKKNSYTEEELYEFLKCYDGFLTKQVIDYLRAVISLEVSVVKDVIANENRELLAELDIYKKAVIYNICKRALVYFEELKKQGFDIYLNANYEFGTLNVGATLEDKLFVPLYEFDYHEKRDWNYRIPEGYETKNIGSITLYQSIEDSTIKEEELLAIQQKLRKLYSEKNPYRRSRKGAIGGPGSLWGAQHAEIIQRYEEQYKWLDQKKELSVGERSTIELTKQVNDYFFEDYGLKNDYFTHKNTNTELLQTTQSKLQKKLSYQIPYLSIEKEIQYL